MSKNTSYEVVFTDVGAKQKCWTERIARPIDSAAIVAAVRRKRAVVSPEIWAPYVHDWSGTIYAGLRPVGSYHIKVNS